MVKLLRMTIMRDHSKDLDSRQLSNNFRHRMPAGAGSVGTERWASAGCEPVIAAVNADAAKTTNALRILISFVVVERIQSGDCRNLE